MAVTPTPRIRMPGTAKKGEVIEIRTLITHEMESGQRRDASGNVVPRKIINKFVVRFNGREIMSADWHPAISADPYYAFFVRAKETGTYEFAWSDDDGTVYKAEQKLTVS